MLICPKCKNEYRDGIKVCADCGCELVAEVKEVFHQAVIYGEAKALEELKSYLEYSGIEEVQIQTDEEDAEKRTALFVEKKNWERARKMTAVYMQQEQLRAMEAQAARMEMQAQEEQEQEEANRPRWVGVATEPQKPKEEPKKVQQVRGSTPGVYMNKKEKAQDNQSAAFSLILVGILGIVFLVLLLLDVFPIGFHGSNRYIVSGVMGAMFLGFIAMGVVSFKNSKRYQEEAKQEDTLTDQMKTWVRENLDVQKMNERLVQDGVLEEELYFKRTELLKMILNHEFQNLEQDYLDHFVDDIYDETFGEKEA